jgi:hypothetical protein
MQLAEGEELETNVLQVEPRNRAKSHAMHVQPCCVGDPLIGMLRAA